MTVLFDKHRPIVSPALAPDAAARSRSVRGTTKSRCGTHDRPDQQYAGCGAAGDRAPVHAPAAGGRGQQPHPSPLLFTAVGEAVAAGKATDARTIHRYRRSRPPAHRRIDRNRRRAERRNPARRAVLAGPHRASSTGRKPTRVRRSGHALPRMPRCCISTASSGNGSSIKCSGVYDCAKVTDDWLTKDITSPLKVAHSRLNALRKGDLDGARISTADGIAGGRRRYLRQADAQPFHLLPGASGI